MGYEALVCPMLNANDPEAVVVELGVAEGQRVEAGDFICALESMKAAVELEASVSGYVRQLAVEVDMAVLPEALICYVADTLEEPLPQPAPEPKSESGTGTAMGAARGSGPELTEPARKLAQELGVDPQTLPTDRIVTTEDVRAAADAGKDVGQDSGQDAGENDATDGRVILFGGGGHARMLLALLATVPELKCVGIIDDKLPAGTEILGARVLGGRNILPQLRGDGIRLALNGLGGVANLRSRGAVSSLLREHGFSLPVVAHETALIEPFARCGSGTQVMAQAVVGAGAVIGEDCIVNVKGLVSHDCVIGAGTHISPGALIGGEVTVGPGVQIGMGAVINAGIRIGERALIGNGAVVHEDVPARAVVRAHSS